MISAAAFTATPSFEPRLRWSDRARSDQESDRRVSPSSKKGAATRDLACYGANKVPPTLLPTSLHVETQMSEPGLLRSTRGVCVFPSQMMFRSCCVALLRLGLEERRIAASALVRASQAKSEKKIPLLQEARRMQAKSANFEGRKKQWLGT